MNKMDLGFNSQEKKPTTKGAFGLSVISLSIVLTACGSSSDNRENTIVEEKQGCGITGSRLLANNGFPYNRFSGSSSSTKTWNSTEEYYDWYPLTLSVSTDRHKAATSFDISSSPSDECYEIASKILINGGGAENNPDLFSDMKVKLTFPDYDYRTRPSEGDLDDVVVTSVSPFIKVINSVNEAVNSSTSIVLSENEYAGTLTCEQAFTISTSWEEKYIVTTDPEIVYTDNDSNDFSIYHNAKFTGDQCEVSLSGEFTLTDGRIMEAGILGRFETVEDKDGYTFFLDALMLGVEN